ncbi:BTB/POZ and MATH domain-containing protein 2-like [Carex rostrata]
MAEIKKTNEAVSVSINKWEEGSHLFKITSHSLLLLNTHICSYKKCIQSAPFEVGGHTWAINYYPQWFTSHSSFYAVLLSEGKDVNAKVQFTLVNESGKPYQGVSTTPYYNCIFNFRRKGSEHGYDYFILHSQLFPYLEDDSFTIKCTLRVLASSVKQHLMPHPIREAPPSKIGSDFGELLVSGEGVDVTFEVKGKLFPAHKCVLAARSPYFRAEFFGPMRKPKMEEHTKVKDIEPEVFMALLHYIYTDSLSKIEQELQFTHTTLAEKLLAVADQFLVDRLKIICEDILCDKISVENAAMRLVLAEQHNCGRLRNACLEFLADTDNMSLVMLTEGFRQISLSCPWVLGDIKVKDISKKC